MNTHHLSDIIAASRKTVFFLVGLPLAMLLLGNLVFSAPAMPFAEVQYPVGEEGSGIFINGQTSPGAALNDFFTLRDKTDLGEMGDALTRELLSPVRGGNRPFGARQLRRYRSLKQQNDIQWRLNDLETGKTISQSNDPARIFFGASVSKLFVAACLLDKQQGRLTREQLALMTSMIAVSSNSAWTALQLEAGDGVHADAGRQAIDAFTRKMGYGPIRGFQGWRQGEIHGNELNVAALSDFLYDTCHNRYPGAEILWKLMHACKTGGNKGNLFMPRDIFIGGKTGTYHGPNASPKTMDWPEILAHHHVMTFNWGGRQYGLAILSNRGNDMDVAVLAGGLVREYLEMPRALQYPTR